MRSRGRIVGFLSLIVMVYGGLVAWFAANETSFLYFPRKQIDTSPEASGMAYGRVEIASTDGVRLTAWLIPSPDTSRLWLLYLHGNAGNIGTPGNIENYAQLRRLGLNILAVDYRGYGGSSGEPSEQGLYDDARASYEYLRTAHHIPPTHILVYGYSLGSAVAVDVASTCPIAGLMIEGSFTSILDVGQEHYPFLPVRWIARNKYDSREKIRNVTVPKLFLHARDDQTIPLHFGRELFALAREPKTFLEVRGGHDDAHTVDPVLFYGGIQMFLVQVRRAMEQGEPFSHAE
jgi:fermentation-respiration switch protein FrsA (DUF1100 family)